MAKGNVKVNPKVSRPAAPVRVPFFLDDRKVGWLLAGIAFLLYAQTIGFDYALDDRAVTYENEFVKAGFKGFGNILSTFYWDGWWDSNSGLFRPVSLLLFATEWQFFPESVHFYHFTNVLLYAVCIYFLYRTLRDLFRDQSVTLAFAATLIWAVMPVHTEVGANIKSADEILCVLFFLLSFRRLLAWADSKKTKDLVLSAVFIFLSLLSKEGAALFIPVMLVALIMFRGKSIREIISPAVIFLIVGGTWLAWHYAVIAGSPHERVVYDYRHNALLSNPSEIDQLGTAIGLQARYWLKMLTGYPLSYNYSFNQIPVNGFADVWTWIALAGTGAAIYFAWKKFRTEPALSFGIIFYFVTFALTSNIFFRIGDIMGDRLAFAPSIGFAIVMAWVILKLTNGIAEKRFHRPAINIVLVIAALYSIRSLTRSQAWEYEENLFTEDVESSPGSGRVHFNYAVLQMGKGEKENSEAIKRQYFDDAYNHYKIALEIDPDDFQSGQNIAVVEYRRGNYKSSAAYTRLSLKKWPVNKSVLTNLGDALMKYLEYDSAIIAYKQAVDAKVATDMTVIKLGDCYLAKKDTASALTWYEDAARRFPKSYTAWDKVANLNGMRGNYSRSNEAFLKLAELKPDDPHPYQMLSVNYQHMGDTAKAQQYAAEYNRRLGK
jgi:protein O-mannosyl-transferase